ncbi:hypothetical protein ACIPL1_29480 [Pseudomonas sp. NPDC090202]|uniref:hypothetical protein n=1 Tax=unclassified Pseudomonas TaxID=196821 RepID=UPI00380D4132
MADPEESVSEKPAGQDASGRYQWREAYACDGPDSNGMTIKSFTDAATVPRKSQNQRQCAGVIKQEPQPFRLRRAP